MGELGKGCKRPWRDRRWTALGVRGKWLPTVYEGIVLSCLLWFGPGGLTPAWPCHHQEGGSKQHPPGDAGLWDDVCGG